MKILHKKFPIYYLVIVFALFLVISGYFINNRLVSDRYQVSQAQLSLLPIVNKQLLKKVSFSKSSHQFVFNKQASKSNSYGDNNPANQLQAGIGGNKSGDNFLYSVSLPTNSKKGITYTDNSLKLSFQLSPEYNTLSGKQVNGRWIYPIDNGGSAIYTLMANGLNENVLYTKPSQVHNLSYHLNLPNTLVAKLVPGTNEVGIYSADPALFGNITFGDAADKISIMKARINSPKNHLAFIIPPPIISHYNKNHTTVNAKFRLMNNQLSVLIPSVSKLTYPISLDPSVAIASSSAFAAGNTDDNINYPTNEIARGGLTGGTINSGWTTSPNTLLATVDGEMAIADKGYVYEMGGYNGTTTLNTINYATISSSGGIGAWTTDTITLPNPTDNGMAVVYNGYVYVIGGYQYGATTYYNMAYDAPLIPTGGVGAWTQTSLLPAALYGGAVDVYNGYVYILGGANSADLSSAYYAKINADGTLQAWATNTAPLPQLLGFPTSVVANSYIYVMGGINGTTYQSTVYYAPINSNGSIGSWITSSIPLTTASDTASSVIYGGYVYYMGGYSGSSYLTSVYFAPVYAGGSIGAWQSTTVLPQAVSSNPAVIDNGYIYLLGGANGSSTSPTYLNTVYYGQIDSAGSLNTWTTTNGFVKQGTGKGYIGRENEALVAYNGYLYSIGSDNAVTQYYDESAPINADGSLGPWVNIANLPASYTGMEAIAYNNYIYAFNGCSSITSGACGSTHTLAQAISSPIGSGGTLGAWTTLTAPGQGNWGGVGVTINGFVYLVGGIDSTGAYDNTVQYAQLTTSGGLTTNAGCGTTWCNAGAFNTGRAFEGVTVANGYLYLAGGTHATSDTACNPTANVNCSDVQYALLTASGNLSTNTCGTSTTWCTTTSLPVGMTGGLYSTRSMLYSPNGYFAPITSTGTVGTWQQTPTFSTARTNYGSAYYLGYLYIAGGDAAGTYEPDAQYAKINNGGMGNTSSYTTLTNNLPFTTYLSNSEVYNGYIYLIGGNSGTYTPNVYFAQASLVNGLVTNLTSCPSGGTLYNGTWCSTTIMPYPTEAGTTALYDGYIYYFGGQTTGASILNTVYSVPINANGTLGSWTALTSMPAIDDLASSALSGNYYYEIGGTNGSAPYKNVYSAQLASGGTLNTNMTSCAGGGTLTSGTWCSETNLPTPLQTSTSQAVNGYLYAMGGYNGSAAIPTVYYAVINSNGSLGAWNQTSPLPGFTSSNTSTVYDGYMYEISGTNPANYKAVIESNGTLGAWETTVALPQVDDYSTAVAYDGQEYVLGGYNGASVLANVYYASINSISRTGHYSDLINLGTYGANLSSITFTGNLANGLGAISYETAGTNGILTSPSTALSLAENPPTNPTGCTTIGGPDNYAWLYITMDDSQNSAFPDSLSPESYVSNITLNYTTNRGHPPPNIRLRLGAYFIDNTLQPLDTCIP